MSTNTALPPIEKVARQHFEYYGSALTTNAALAVVTLALSAAIAIQGVMLAHVSKRVHDQKPLIVRINEVGQAQTVDYRFSDYSMQPNEARYFINTFVTKFYSRNHHTLAADYPTSLLYLSQELANQVDAEDRKTKWTAKFLSSDDDDVYVDVRNVALDDSQKPVYKATVDFEKIYRSRYGSGTSKTERYIGTMLFRVDPSLASKDPEMVKNNPLGFSIQYLRADQAFDK